MQYCPGVGRSSELLDAPHREFRSGATPAAYLPTKQELWQTFQWMIFLIDLFALASSPPISERKTTR